MRLWGVEHVDFSTLIINAASHYHGHLHQWLSACQPSNVTPDEWNKAGKEGLKQWNSEPQPARKGHNNTQEANDI